MKMREVKGTKDGYECWDERRVEREGRWTVICAQGQGGASIVSKQNLTMEHKGDPGFVCRCNRFLEHQDQAVRLPPKCTRPWQHKAWCMVHAAAGCTRVLA